MSGYGTSVLRRRPRVISPPAAGSHQSPVRLWTDASGKVGVIATLRSMPDRIVEGDLARHRRERSAGHAVEPCRSLVEDRIVPGGGLWCSPLRTTPGEASSHFGPSRVDDGLAPALLLDAQPGGWGRGRRHWQGGCRGAEIEAVAGPRRQHGRREIDVPQQVGRIRAVFPHGASDGVGHGGRQVLISASCDGFGFVPVESIPDNVALVPRGVAIFAGGNAMQSGADGVERLLAPRSEVVEAPLDTAIRVAGLARCMGEVGQVGVFQQMDWSKPLWTLGESGYCRSVLVDGVQARKIGHQASGGRYGKAAWAGSVSRHPARRCPVLPIGPRPAVSAPACQTCSTVRCATPRPSGRTTHGRAGQPGRPCATTGALSTDSPGDSRRHRAGCTTRH